MPEGKGRDSRILEAVRIGLVLLVWALWLPCHGLVTLLGWGPPNRLRRRIRRVQGALLVAATAAVALDLVPVWWAGAAWRAEALHACRRPGGRSDAELVAHLRRVAFQRGLVDVEQLPAAVAVERHREDDEERIHASLAMEQEVTLLGLWVVRVPVHAATEATVEQREAPQDPWKSLEDLLVR